MEYTSHQIVFSGRILGYSIWATQMSKVIDYMDTTTPSGHSELEDFVFTCPRDISSRVIILSFHTGSSYNWTHSLTMCYTTKPVPLSYFPIKRRIILQSSRVYRDNHKAILSKYHIFNLNQRFAENRFQHEDIYVDDGRHNCPGRAD